MMKTHKNGQKLRLKVIDALKKNEGFGGKETANMTIGRIMAIMEIEDVEIQVKS